MPCIHHIPLRRVKCDEGKPSCRRCTTAGRICDGYDQQSKAAISLSWENHPWTHSWTPFVRPANGGVEASPESYALPQLLLPPRLLVFDSAEEQQSYDFFRSRSVGELTEVFHIDETFWNLCVLQMSMTQPAVRYAVAALGAMHRIYGTGNTTAIPEDTSGSQTRFALEQCNRSIKSLLERRGSEARAEKLSTLVACILYTCLASIQGHQRQSIMHLRNGMKLLDNLVQQKDVNNSGPLTSYNTQIQSFLTTLSSLEIQARSLMCEEDLPAWPTRTRIRGSSFPPTDIRFSSLSEARDFFESVLSDFQCFALERDTENEWLLSPGASPRRSVMDDYELLVKKHSFGVEALESFIAKHDDDLDKRDQKTILMLRLHIDIVEMYLRVYPLSLKHGELAWDHLEPYYLRIIRLGRQILGCTEDQLSSMLCSPSEVEKTSTTTTTHDHSGKTHKYPKIPPAASILKKEQYTQRQHRPVFAFSQGVVGPLSTVAVMSRSPNVRREAIALLLLYPRREGLWDSHTAGRVAWVGMCLEEEMALERRGQHHEEEREIKAASDIPAECRVRVVDMKYIGARTGEIHYNTGKQCEKGDKGEKCKVVKILEW
ncbi:hypothetical protein G647_02958 [Cladophialophora carrionii CBS 160.54]|uniref:Zn(2)-C6 fungal-type domain-containing protein n=1 Tax=Cladophialophora carrionii CBS 160.54 TaxID=1279043 RepID=V9DHK8_9EURO|nr:uncharacterized protein G647_02958 [Cladophialophora carrionii CBS 160.54]ETI26181.1 hypothetical protein G647_02958 [Cladophialophora carrionii CBS 160.54]